MIIQITDKCTLGNAHNNFVYFIATNFILCLMTLAQGQQQETGITLNVF